MSGQCGSVIEWVLDWRDVAAYQDPFVTAYSAELPADKARVGGVTVAPSPESIVVRKDNPAPGNVPRQALAVIIPDGTYVQIPADPWATPTTPSPSPPTSGVAFCRAGWRRRS
jgi:hypothetical protein